MYTIKAKFYYYGGTAGAPKSGLIRDPHGKIAKFPTKPKALDFLEEYYGKMILQRGKSTYTIGGRYTLRHGEYSTPEFTIINSRKAI